MGQRLSLERYEIAKWVPCVSPETQDVRFLMANWLRVMSFVASNKNRSWRVHTATIFGTGTSSRRFEGEYIPSRKTTTVVWWLAVSQCWQESCTSWVWSFIPWFTRFCTSQVVAWDFCTINSSAQKITTRLSCKRLFLMLICTGTTPPSHNAGLKKAASLIPSTKCRVMALVQFGDAGGWLQMHKP